MHPFLEAVDEKKDVIEHVDVNFFKKKIYGNYMSSLRVTLSANEIEKKAKLLLDSADYTLPNNLTQGDLIRINTQLEQMRRIRATLLRMATRRHRRKKKGKTRRT